MNAHEKSVRARFTAAAGSYDSYARVQKRVASKLATLMPASPWPRRILEIGCGSGQFTERLLAGGRASTVHAIDVSGGMVREARARLGRDRRLSLAVADLLAFESATPYGLIGSSCALHWITPLQAAMERVAGLLEEGGLLVCALMLRSTLGELHEARLRVAPAKPPLGRLPEPEDVRVCFEAAGFVFVRAFDEVLTASYPSAAAFLADIRGQGVTGGAVSRSTAPLSRREIRALAADYDAHYRQPDGSVRAGFHVFYAKAVRGAGARAEQAVITGCR
ncbi:MAG: methyltransferase domain-containing protein [Kiritimatiellae bacterium]|nr:methyltransferase domain-containing protein [Kiritimatiellia bacterium]